MANRFVTINGEKYTTSERKFRPIRNKALQINVTIDGQTASQLFGFTDQRWTLQLVVYLTAPSAGFGGIANLRSAYDLHYCNFVDQDGTDQGNCFIEGEFPEDREFSLVDPDVPFYINLTIRKRQIS